MAIHPFPVKLLTSQEHGGLVVSNPFYAPFPPTHIILDVPGQPSYYSYVLPSTYPVVQLAEFCQPYQWKFEDLVAYALVRRATGFPVTLMQSPWLRECVAVGKVVKDGDAAEAWRVR